MRVLGSQEPLCQGSTFLASATKFNLWDPVQAFTGPRTEPDKHTVTGFPLQPINVWRPMSLLSGLRQRDLARTFVARNPPSPPITPEKSIHLGHKNQRGTDKNSGARIRRDGLQEGQGSTEGHHGGGGRYHQDQPLAVGRSVFFFGVRWLQKRTAGLLGG